MSVAIWVLGMASFVFSAGLTAVVVWRDGSESEPIDLRLLELSHLLTWSLTAPVAAFATVS